MSMLSKIIQTVLKTCLHINPTGTLIPYMGDTPPLGYLKCDGAEVSRTTYARLFRVIGTTYGTGDGSNTFNLPDFKNKTFWGADNNLGKVFTSGLPNITGNSGAKFFNISDVSGPFYTSTTSQSAPDAGTDNTTYTSIAFDASLSNSIYGRSSIVQPPAISLNILIKY